MIEVLVSIVIVKAPGHQHPQYWLSIFMIQSSFLVMVTVDLSKQKRGLKEKCSAI